MGLILSETRQQIYNQRSTVWHELSSRVPKMMAREKFSLLPATIAWLFLMIQMKRSFAFIFLLMIIWKNCFFETQHCVCAFSCAYKVSACAWWTLSFHSRGLWGPGWGSALTRGSNSRWNWAVFSFWCYLRLSHLKFLPWGVGNNHILCLLFLVLPVGLQGVSPPTWLRCTSCHKTPIKRFFWSPNSWAGQCREDGPTLVACSLPG